jgi:hypothetical protein
MTVRLQEAQMPQDLDQQIRERAYHLWMADGCRDGEAEQYWLTAERDVLAEFAAATAPTESAPKPRSRRAVSANADAPKAAKPRRRAAS